MYGDVTVVIFQSVKHHISVTMFKFVSKYFISIHIVKIL